MHSYHRQELSPEGKSHGLEPGVDGTLLGATLHQTGRPDMTWAFAKWNWSWNILDTLCPFHWRHLLYFCIFWVSGILKKRHCRCFWRLFHHYIEENGSTTLDICKLSRVSTWFDRPWQSWQAWQVWVAWLFPRAKDVLSLLSFIAMWEEHGKYASVCGLDVGCCEKMYYNGSGFKSLGRDMIRPQIWHSTFKLFCLEEVFFLKPGRPWHIVLTTSQRSRAHTHTPTCTQTWCYSTEVGRVG